MTPTRIAQVDAHEGPVYVAEDDALYFTTGRTERKAKNLAQNPHCVVTTGCNVLDGLDVVPLPA